MQRPCGWRLIDVLTAEQGGQCGWKRVSRRKVLVDVRTRSQITWQLLGHHKDFHFTVRWEAIQGQRGETDLLNLLPAL